MCREQRQARCPRIGTRCSNLTIRDLIDLSESEVVKVDDTYLPELRKGVRDPICPRPNVLVESGRVSYSGLVQLMPRRITWPKGLSPRRNMTSVCEVALKHAPATTT